MPDPDDLALSPAQEAEVRRLLAEARHDGPIPGDVAARLDAALASMGHEDVEPFREAGADAGGAGAAGEAGAVGHAQEAAAAGAAGRRSGRTLGPTGPSVGAGDDVRGRATPAPSEAPAGRQEAPVVDLAARRRRRWTSGLVAAAAVVALGVSLPEILPEGGEAGMETSAEGGDSGGGSTADQAERPAPPEAAASERSATEPEAGLAAPVPLPRVRAQAFAADAVRAREVASRALLAEGTQRTDQDQALVTACGPPLAADELGVAVRYRGSQAVLVYRSVPGGGERAELYRCGEDEPIRSTTLPTP